MDTWASRQPLYQDRGPPGYPGPDPLGSRASPRIQYGQSARRPSGALGGMGTDAAYAQYGNDVQFQQGAAATQRDPSTWSEGETVAIMGTVGNLLGQAGTVVTSIINGNNQRQRDELQAATAIRLQEIRSQAAAAAEPGLRAQLAAQAEMLASVTRALEARTPIPVVAPPPPDNTKLYIGAAVGLALLAGIGYVATRKNPHESPEENPTVMMYGQKRFVSAKNLEKIRRRLAQRHAAGVMSGNLSGRRKNPRDRHALRDRVEALMREHGLWGGPVKLHEDSDEMTGGDVVWIEGVAKEQFKPSSAIAHAAPTLDFSTRSSRGVRVSHAAQ